MLLLALTLPLLVAASIALLTWLAMPKPFADQPKDLLICCAHSDDCAILGAEYAYGVLQLGKSIHIVYLTCSSYDPHNEMATIRRTEALSAWSSVGVPARNLTFIDLPASPIAGPIAISNLDASNAVETIVAAIVALPANAALLFPAEAESHVDHRAVRALTLQALAISDRPDLTVYESPQYNSVLSFVRCPRKALRTMLQYVPFINRLVEPYSGLESFVSGPHGFCFDDTPARLSMKRKLLACFASQGSETLVRFFGHKAVYRPTDLNKPELPVQTFRMRAFGCECDYTIPLMTIAFLGIVFLTVHQITSGLEALLPSMTPLSYLFAALLASIYTRRWYRGLISNESLIFAGAFAAGVLFAASA